MLVDVIFVIVGVFILFVGSVECLLSFFLGHGHHLLLHLNLLLHLHGAFRAVLLHQFSHVLLLLLGVFLVLRASGYLVGLFFEGQSKGAGK